MTHVYIVRCRFTAPEKEAAWNAWYSGPKLKQMLTQPHFLSCQRFRRAAGSGRDYLALWTVSRAEALTTPQYRSQWGFAEWERDVTDWSRDLFDAGARDFHDFAVAPGGTLEVIWFDGVSVDDMKATNAAIVQAGQDMMWLPIAGLDRHTPVIGLRPSHDSIAPAAPIADQMQHGAYRPLFDFQTAAAA